MCDQCPDDSDAVEEARWALDAAWEEVARKEDARIWKEERQILSKEDAEARAMAWIGRARMALTHSKTPKLEARV